MSHTIARRWPLTFRVLPDQAAAFVNLAHSVETSPSMLGQLAVAMLLAEFEDVTPLVPHAHDDGTLRLVRLTANVHHEEYEAFLALALRARTSIPSLGQLAVSRLLSRSQETELPICPASCLPEDAPRLSPAGSFSPGWDA